MKGVADIENLESSAIYASGDVFPVSHGGFQGGHTSTYWNDSKSGKLCIFGGYNGHNRTNDLYVLKNAHLVGQEDQSHLLEWEKSTITNSSDRAGHTSFISDHFLYSYGGYDSKHKVLDDLVKIDLSSPNYASSIIPYKGTISNLDRRWHCSFFSENNMYVHGGWNDTGSLGDFNRLNFANMKWETLKCTGAVPSNRRWHTLTPLQSNASQVFLFGGYNGSKDPLGDQYLFDISRKTWSSPKTFGDIPSCRCRHTMTNLNDKVMLLIGGYTLNDQTSKDIHILTLDNMKWTKIKNVGKLFAVQRSGQRVSVVPNGCVLSGGLFLPDFVEDFYFLDLRMLSIWKK